MKLTAAERELLVNALRVEADAFRAMLTGVELDETTLGRLHASLIDAQLRIGQLKARVSQIAYEHKETT